MLKGIVTKVVGDPNQRAINKMMPTVERCNELEAHYEAQSDAELLANTASLRDRLESGESLEDVLPEAFALVREASKRTIGLRPYDVQIIGAIVLHEGQVAEMKTGEGKTLVAAMPLYLNALTGKGAHLVTPNDYLSKVGVQWMGPIYSLLGLSAGVIQNIGNNPEMASFVYDPEYQADDDRYQHLRPVDRREAYQADILYGTNNEFGFDYLRDNMVWDLSHRVQRELHYAIVDEVDNILIDEARTPLIISGPAEEATDWYGKFAELVRRLRQEDDFTIDEKTRVVTPTDNGIEKIERALGIDNMYSPEHYELTPYFENALKAQALFNRDHEYIVKDGEVIIVDEFTGRLMPGRRFSEGLHQAIEAKEGVRVQRESMTMATITFQNYFRMYDKLAGMTGTAETEAEELHKIYELDVTVIPTHRPTIRDDRADLVYKTTGAKWKAVVDEIAERSEAGQPVLVGTVAVETSEMLSRRLSRRGVRHEVLNAKNHEREAEIIAQAGSIGSVTIATNMAGRGVDILLGGNWEGIARAELRKKGVDLTVIPAGEWDDAVAKLRGAEDPTAEHNTEWAAELKRAWDQCSVEREQVLDLGGLFVLGTERHEARRIDNQLRGRSGRQGDPGASRFFVALEDDLMIRFGGERVKSLMDTLGVEEDQVIESGMVSKQIEQAQVKVEGHNFDLRKHLLEYDEVINEQRRVIYDQRTEVLKREDLRPTIWEMTEGAISGIVGTYTAAGYAEDWDLAGLATAINAIFPLPEEEDPETWRNWSAEEVEGHVLALASDFYDAKAERLGPELMHQLERAVILRTIDTWWVRHLTALDELRTGIGLRAFGQQDPLVTFKREGYSMFQSLLSNVTDEIVRAAFHAEPVAESDRRPRLLDKARTGRGRMIEQAQQRAAERPAPVKTGPKLGRNDPCWCGSGKKYKHCHWKSDRAGGDGEKQGGAGASGEQEGRRRRKKSKR